MVNKTQKKKEEKRKAENKNSIRKAEYVRQAS